MNIEEKIKINKANHKLWIKNLKRYGELDSKRLDKTITPEEREEMKYLKMPPATWKPNNDTITKKEVKKKKKAPPKPEPEPEIIPEKTEEVYIPPDPVLEIIDAGLLEEEPVIELTPEEKKALRIAELEAKVKALEGTE